MYYGEIKKCDIANGEGVRVSLFVSGCTHHCPGCFNEDTWDFHYGKKYTEAMKLVKECDSELKNIETKVNKIVNENGKLEDFEIS